MAMKHAFFVCLIITFLFSCSSETTTSGNINWWCTQTPYYETCNHYIAEPNPYMTTISTNQFLDMTVQAAIDEARVALKRAQGIESKYPNVPGKSLWGSCVEYIDGIVFTLNMVLNHTLHPTQLDVQTWLSASLAYINVCEKGFELINMTNTMLPLISTNLTQLILNSLAISVLFRGSNTNNAPESVDWKQRDLALECTPNVVVAQDGSGDFETVQEAVNSASNRTQSRRYVIYVKAGIYDENVVIPRTVEYITMFGDGINKTIITGSRGLGGDMVGTSKAGDLKQTATFQVWGRGFIARDITFRNTAGPQGEKAVALLTSSDQSAFYHCSIEGYQDTLFTFSSKQFYKECQIFGTVDFIFGDAPAVFQDCEIFIRKPPLEEGGLVVTANGRKYENETSGYTLQGCKITAADDLKPVIDQHKAFLGRPWYPHAETVYMQCFLDELVDPKGWMDTWGYNETIYYGEYKNYVPGSSTDERVKWSGYHAIDDPNIAEDFTVDKFMSGNQWLPATGVPFTSGFENL
ncbi:pectinesterase [Lactuca sativa]|uniref:Pectinesterase n=1 Tax=Lactuca sativa TaxID=4236 RepID=A0A9R1WER0_LACSA|nr:pectinesterase [Lactuca sativa]KAJ0221457.1 hypothetical protein LSAT_V11C200098250 [Lactuca sativa]